ncbi:hypothetical protein EVAR_25342_1 [Eumeta japonica]|uniref:Uncharacterized protein n=1 Tax=Eumeta variegata TaxID=151549 RepID=A0A4C1XWN6_EUMVA|nr:hypothetical protein EVAR_25342_1 [Eumeta japonica]
MRLFLNPITSVFTEVNAFARRRRQPWAGHGRDSELRREGGVLRPAQPRGGRRHESPYRGGRAVIDVSERSSSGFALRHVQSNRITPYIGSRTAAGGARGPRRTRPRGEMCAFDYDLDHALAGRCRSVYIKRKKRRKTPVIGSRGTIYPDAGEPGALLINIYLRLIFFTRNDTVLFAYRQASDFERSSPKAGVRSPLSLFLIHEQVDWGRSTTEAGVELIQQIFDACEDSRDTIGVFFDLSRAFDCVHHDTLIRKLHHYGVMGRSLGLLESYLSDRIQRVDISESRISPTNISNTYGIVTLYVACVVTDAGRQETYMANRDDTAGKDGTNGMPTTCKSDFGVPARRSYRRAGLMDAGRRA